MEDRPEDVRLILIEGMVGVGKSTTAERLAARLTDCGEDARAYLEFAADHPIRTKAVDLLRAAYPTPVWTPGDAGADGPALDRGVYATGQWGRLAERCLRGARTVILESTLLQNSVLPAFVNGAPAGKCTEIFARIQEQVAPARPLLVYLRPADIPAAIDRARRDRGEPWTSWNAASVAGYPWARSRDLRGRDAVVELYREWEAVAGDLYDRYPFPKVMIEDPQNDRDGTLTRIHRAARH